MRNHASAQDGAPVSAICNQGTGPSTSPEQTLGRDPAQQGNTHTETRSDKPLSMWAQVELVRKAMNRKHDRNFDEWGSKDLASLLDYQSDEGQSMDTYITFFRDLLLFLANPKVSQQFSETVPNGIERIKALSGFFIDLLGHTDYDQFVAYHRMYDNYKEDDAEVFLSYAEDYLTGEDLRRVMAAHGREPEVSEDATPENKGAHLVVLLDRYFPGVVWKDDKLAIATHEKMKWFLEHQEEKRIKEEQQTPDEKKAEEVRRQIEFQLEHGFYFRKDAQKNPEITDALGSAVKPAAGAVSGRGSAVTKKKPAPIKKPSPKKKA